MTNCQQNWTPVNCDVSLKSLFSLTLYLRNILAASIPVIHHDLVLHPQHSTKEEPTPMINYLVKINRNAVIAC